MAMTDKHVPVRIEETIYKDIKELSVTLGMSTKKLVELLLMSSLENLKKKDAFTLTINRDKAKNKITLE